MSRVQVPLPAPPLREVPQGLKKLSPVAPPPKRPEQEAACAKDLNTKTTKKLNVQCRLQVAYRRCHCQSGLPTVKNSVLARSVLVSVLVRLKRSPVELQRVQVNTKSFAAAPSSSPDSPIHDQPAPSRIRIPMNTRRRIQFVVASLFACSCGDSVAVTATATTTTTTTTTTLSTSTSNTTASQTDPTGGEPVCPGDSFEPNNNTAQAVNIADGEITSVVCPFDDDYFRINVSGEVYLSAILYLTRDDGTLSLDLLGSNMESLRVSAGADSIPSYPSQGVDAIHARLPGDAVYFLRVTHYTGDAIPYNLVIRQFVDETPP